MRYEVYRQHEQRRTQNPAPAGSFTSVEKQSEYPADECDKRFIVGQIMTEGSRNGDDIVIADMDLDIIREVRNVWQFFRDRRPDSYEPIVTE